MLNNKSVISAIIFLLLGAVLLYGSVSGSDASQTVRLLAGATLVTFGFLTLLLIAKDWLDWKRHNKSGGPRRDHI